MEGGTTLRARPAHLPHVPWWAWMAAVVCIAAGALLVAEPAEAQACNYSITDHTQPGGPVPNYVDISTTGTQLFHGLDTQIDVALPWTTYYCGTYTPTVTTSSNGYVCFDVGAWDCTSFVPHFALPQTGTPNNAVFAYWTDLFVGNCSTANCGTHWEIQGSAPNRVFIYSFKDVPFWSNGGAISFQMKLEESSFCWEVHYEDVTAQSTQSTVAGIEDLGGTAAITWQNVAAPGFSAKQEAWRVCPLTPPPPPPPPPPPACGYTIDTSIPYDFVEISPGYGGSGIGVPNGDYTAMALTPSPPMPITFCGNTYETFWLSAKGSICFGAEGFPTGDMWNYPSECPKFWGITPLPNAKEAPNNAIYGYWADLYPGACGGVKCNFYDIQGPVGERVLIYEFRDVPFFYDWSWSGPVTFQIKVFELSGCFEVHYEYVDIYPGGWDPSVAGFEDASGKSGYMYNYGSPAFAAKEEAWGACPFGAGSDTVVFNEDQGMASFDVLANDNGAGEPITLTGHTEPGFGKLVPGIPGSFSYAPQADFAGTDSFTYTIETPSGKKSTGTVLLVVNPVNDPPSFQPGLPSVIVSPLETAYEEAGWATLVAPGPANANDEADQGITFQVSKNTNAGLFAVQPTLVRTDLADNTEPGSGPYAVLAFEHAGAFGSSLVCFEPVDDGGTADQVNSWGDIAKGQDTGPAQCVEIIVNSPPVAYFETSAEGVAPGDAIGFLACPRAVPHCSYDPDGGSFTHLWDFGDGYRSEEEAPVHAYAVQGTYKASLTLRDEWGSTSVYMRLVPVVSPGGEPDELDAEGTLLANAGPDRTVPEGNLVQLPGAQSGGGEATVFHWEQVMGAPVELDGQASPILSFQAPRLPASVPFELVFSLRVHDAGVESEPDFVVVHVVGANSLPVADAGAPQRATVGALVRLDGSPSHDPDGDAVTLRWEQLPGGPRVVLSDPTAASPTFQAPEWVGTLEFRLRVSDGRSAHQAETSVAVDPLPSAVQAPSTQTPEAQETPRPAAQAASQPGPDRFALAGIGAAFLAAAGACVYLVLRGRKV